MSMKCGVKLYRCGVGFNNCFLNPNTQLLLNTRTNFSFSYSNILLYRHILHRHLLHRHLFHRHHLYRQWLIPTSTRPSLDLRSPTVSHGSPLAAKLGTEMMDVFQAALKIGRNIGKMADKVQTEFLAMAKSAEEVVDKWLAKHVGKRLDALRAHFGDVKPEDQPDKHFSIPSGEGVYIKIKDCGELADEDGETLEAPYFDCYPYEENQKKSIRRRLLDSKGFFGDDDDNDLDDDQKKTTEIGEHKGPDKSRYYFDCTFEKMKSFEISVF